MSDARPWEALFYEPDLLETGAGDADSGDAVGFYTAATRGVGRVLDIGCGAGRIAVPLAHAGCEVHAVDRSPRVLRYFRAKLAKLPIRKRIKTALLDIRVRPYGSPVDAALAADDFLTHFLDEEALRLVLANIRASLRDGGRFFTDLRGKTAARLREAAAPLPRPWLSFGIVSGVRTKNGLRSAAMQSIETYDAKRRILTSDQRYDIVKPDGEVERSFYRTIRQRLWTVDDIARAADGFKVESSARYQTRGRASAANGASLVLTA